MKKTPIEGLDELKLRGFARDILGIPEAASMAMVKLIPKFQAAWAHDYILEDDAPQAVVGTYMPPPTPTAPSRDEIEAKAGAGIAPASCADDPIVDLIISEADTEDGKHPVFVSCNGNAMVIARGKPQAVPWRMYLALVAATQRLFSQNQETREITFRDVPRFPFQMVAGGRNPTAGDIARWEVRQVELCNQTPPAKLLERARAA